MYYDFYEFIRSDRPKYVDMVLRKGMDKFVCVVKVICPCVNDEHLLDMAKIQLSKDIENGSISQESVYAGFGDVCDREGTGLCYML